MNDARPPAELATPDDDDGTDRNAAIIAADDTGLLTSEIQITDAELREGGVTPAE
jgi:hypothetical protein